MKQEWGCQEVFEAVVAAGRGKERSEFSATDNSQSRRHLAGQIEGSAS